MIKRELFCAKCDCATDSLFMGLCSECADGMMDRFSQVSDLSYEVRKEMCEKFDVRDERYAFVIDRFGRPKERETIKCNRCGHVISEGEKIEHEDSHHGGEFGTHICKYCQNEIDRDHEETLRRDRAEWDSI